MTNNSLTNEAREQISAAMPETFKYSDPRFANLEPWLKCLVFIHEARTGLQLAKRFNTDTALPQQEQLIVTHSLFRAAIATYAKLFVSSASGMVSLDPKEVFKEAPDTRVLHDDIITLRHSFVAHNGAHNVDSANLGVREFDDHFEIAHFYTLALPAPSFDSYEALFEHVESYLVFRMNRALDKLEKALSKRISFYKA